MVQCERVVSLRPAGDGTRSGLTDAFFLLLLLFSASISGCVVFSEQEPEEEKSPQAPFSIPRISPGTPLVLNETLEGKVWYEFGQDTKDCVLVDDDGSYHSSSPRVAYIQYDRFDLQQQVTEQVDSDSTTLHFNFTLIGEAPYLVFLNAYICADKNHFSGVHNVIEGAQIGNREQRREMQERSVYYGNITVPQLETTGSDSWNPPKTFFRFNGALFRYDFEGNPWGTVRMLDPDGHLRTWDDYSFSGFGGGGEMMSRGPPGAYSLELELSEPTITDTRWAYYIAISVFTEGVCILGFEWDFLCT